MSMFVCACVCVSVSGYVCVHMYRLVYSRQESTPQFLSADGGHCFILIHQMAPRFDTGCDNAMQ